MADSNVGFAKRVLDALSTDAALDGSGFQINQRVRRNVSRLITALLQRRLSRSEPISQKTLAWEGGVVSFKNYVASQERFWTKANERDLETDDDDARAWVCSTFHESRRVLHVWVLPFSLIRGIYDKLPTDRAGRRDLSVVRRQSHGNDSWAFKLASSTEESPELNLWHHQFDVGGMEEFRSARAVDFEKSKLKTPEPGPTSAEPAELNSEPDSMPEAVEVPATNRIYFGPPGTGKSRLIRGEVGDAAAAGRCKTVTFHPEYTYADFVGTYRPVMTYSGNEELHDGSGNIDHLKGRPAVVYRFVAGPLTKLICEAMCKPDEHFYLVIEEINRGNCAAICGDLFQLLDRLEDGESEYAVSADADLILFVNRQLRGQPKEACGRLERDGLYFPSNLSIVATMNTSDQSLYPMDSAMKRRWEMRYVPIDYDQARGRRVHVPGHGEMDWGQVLQSLNREIVNHTHSDDKQIGQWFLRGQKITAEAFRDKVLSYLWFDVFRHSPSDLFDLGGRPNSYENLVAACNANASVFRKGVLDVASQPVVEAADGT